MFDRNRAIGAARLRHFRAMLVLRGRSLADVARAVHVAPPHLRLVVLGERRPSQRLVDALRAVVGDDVLAFVERGEPQGEREFNAR